MLEFPTIWILDDLGSTELQHQQPDSHTKQGMAG